MDRKAITNCSNRGLLTALSYFLEAWPAYKKNADDNQASGKR